jgi:DNA-binding response OmpR family regulator
LEPRFEDRSVFDLATLRDWIPAPPDPAESGWGGERLRVLIADDTLDAGESVDILLKSIDYDDYDVLVTDDANGALRRAGDWKPHMAVLDVGMPGMNGFALAVALREQHPDILLVALSGLFDDESTDRAHIASFDLLLEKGRDIRHFHAPFKALMGSRPGATPLQQP